MFFFSSGTVLILNSPSSIARSLDGWIAPGSAKICQALLLPTFFPSAPFLCLGDFHDGEFSMYEPCSLLPKLLGFLLVPFPLPLGAVSLSACLRLS